MTVQPLRKDAIEHSTMRARVKAMIGAGIALSRIAIETGLRQRELQLWLDGTESADKVERRLSVWLEEVDAANSDENEPGWVETETSKDIMAALERARMQPTIAVVYGAAGCGKTISAKRYCEALDRPGASHRDDQVIYVCAGVYLKTPTAILAAIGEAVGAYGDGYRTSTLFDAVLKRIGQRTLLVVDEAQFLDAECLDGLRYFYDAGQIGIAYLGNEVLFKRISGQGKRAAFAQLHSRVGVRLYVQCPTDADVDGCLSAWGFAGRAERAFAVQIANGPGGLRSLTTVLRDARILARETAQPRSERVMRSVASLLRITE